MKIANITVTDQACFLVCSSQVIKLHNKGSAQFFASTVCTCSIPFQTRQSDKFFHTEPKGVDDCAFLVSSNIRSSLNFNASWILRTSHFAILESANEKKLQETQKAMHYRIALDHSVSLGVCVTNKRKHFEEFSWQQYKSCLLVTCQSKVRTN